ncbi:hypothetical protein [Sulfitobacter sp.]|jgi:hypothetical protein|uniref:hypothetical protein n=1 Tax=Sulfitobacter sp. TaxID=1903071 RepID=UPI000C5D7733|nr:hypothetical protein [Roseobacter sp.]|tara:strand:+ start:6443 stop:7288 length:846 start_codon:yes stop_codon:yes gene_type:complete
MGASSGIAGALMEIFEPVFIDVTVPDQVLLRTDPLLPSASKPYLPACHPNDTDAIWYCGHAPAMTFDNHGAILIWQPENNLGGPARQADPNTGHARLGETGGVVYHREINGGFVIDSAIVDAEKFCCALRVKSDQGQARTLLTVNPDQHGNYLFASEKDGILEWRDDGGTVSVSVPSPGGEFWVVLGYDCGRLRISTAKSGDVFPPPRSSTDQADDLAVALGGANDLFIGCRSHRKGILKTLGASTIRDVLIWLDHDGGGAVDQSKIIQACRFVESGGDRA